MPLMSERFVVLFNRRHFGFVNDTVDGMWKEFINAFNHYVDGELQTTGNTEAWASHCNESVVPGMLNPGIHRLVELVAIEMDDEWTERQANRVDPPSFGEISTGNLQKEAITILNWQYLFKEEDADIETGSLIILMDAWIDRAFMAMKESLLALYNTLVEHYNEEFGDTDDNTDDETDA